jgi:hypothetical protein
MLLSPCTVFNCLALSTGRALTQLAKATLFGTSDSFIGGFLFTAICAEAEAPDKTASETAKEIKTFLMFPGFCYE